MKNHFKKHWAVYAVLGLMALAFLIRGWKFQETLYFKMDQARDAALVREVLEKGPGYLPLLGPRAAGTYLRLGPAFYYFQALAVFVFQSAEPFVLAYPDLILSIFAIPVFYYFLRQFFSRPMSLIPTGLYALSFLATQYARFAWNPNQTSLWGLLFLLGIYKSATAEKKRGLWLLLAAAAYSVASQLHFTAFLVLPLVAVVFWVFYRPSKIRWYFWILALAIVGFFYTPVILSDLSTDFNNSKQFLYALTNKAEEHPIRSKVAQSLWLHGQYYSLFLSSYGNNDDLIFVIFFLALVAFALWRGVGLFKKTEQREKRAFLVLVLIWMVVFGGFYTQLSFTVLKPRFWLLVIFIPFVILALFFDWIYQPGRKKRGRWLIGMMAVFLLAINFYATGFWFWMLQTQRELPQGSPWFRDLVLKQWDLVTLKKMRQATETMSQAALAQNKKVCFYTDGDYRAAYEYVFDVYNPEARAKRISFDSDTREKCAFFSIAKHDDRDLLKLPRKYNQDFSGLQRFDFGVITVWEMERTDFTRVRESVLEEIIEDESELEEILEEKEAYEQEREIQEELEEQAEELAEEQEEDEEDKIIDIEKPKRKQRVFWKDLWEEE